MVVRLRLRPVLYDDVVARYVVDGLGYLGWGRRGREGREVSYDIVLNTSDSLLS